jgi:hypothetical protein
VHRIRLIGQLARPAYRHLRQREDPSASPEGMLLLLLRVSHCFPTSHGPATARGVDLARWVWCGIPSAWRSLTTRCPGATSPPCTVPKLDAGVVTRCFSGELSSSSVLVDHSAEDAMTPDRGVVQSPQRIRRNDGTTIYQWPADSPLDHQAAHAASARCAPDRGQPGDTLRSAYGH